MTIALHRPRDVAEALALLGDSHDTTRTGSGGDGPAPRFPLGGGTQLNSSEYRELLIEEIALDGIVPRGIESMAATMSVGAMTTFQELIDTPGLPPILVTAARGMADRNIRNRATIGGNLGADKSCSSLIPALLALNAGLVLLDGRKLRLEDWLELPAGAGGRGVVAKITIDKKRDRLAGYARWSRVSCDLALLGVAAAFSLEGGAIRGLRLALGGVAPHARRFLALEAVFEGRPLPARETIETLVAGNDRSGEPYISPIADARGSVDFKRLRMAILVADAILFAKADVPGSLSTEADA